MASFAHGADRDARDEPGRAYLHAPMNSYVEDGRKPLVDRAHGMHGDSMRVSSMVLSHDAHDLPREMYGRRDVPGHRPPELEHAPMPVGPLPPTRAPAQWEYGGAPVEPRDWRPPYPPREPSAHTRTHETRTSPHMATYENDRRAYSPAPHRAYPRASPEALPHRAYDETRRLLPPRADGEFEYAVQARPAEHVGHGAMYHSMHAAYPSGRASPDEGSHAMQGAHGYPLPKLRDEGEAQRAKIPHHHHVVPHHHHVVPHHHHHHHHHHHTSAATQEVPSPPKNVPWQEQMPAPTSNLRARSPGVARGTPEGEPTLHALEAKQRELASGPRVDSEPVWEYLDRCEQMEELERKRQKEQHAEEERARDQGSASAPPAPAKTSKDEPTPASDTRMLLGIGLGLDRGRAVRHLGSFVYDASGKSCLPAELLVGNVGATVEVRICGRTIGAGITEAEWRAEEARHRAAVLERIQSKANDGVPPTLASLALDANERRPETLASTPGRWRLGWRGLEHARMNREICIANIWNEHRLRQETNKRLKRTHTDDLPAAAVAPPRATPSAAAPSVDAEQNAWNFWSQPSLARRKLWGTDVYTDDSDVLAMCVHAGWIEAPHIPHVPEWLGGGGTSAVSKAWVQLTDRQERAMGHVRRGASPNTSPHGMPLTCDLSVTLRIAPKLILYKGCHRGGIKSRSWGNTHDGVSLVVESVELRPSGYAAGPSRKSAKARMAHMAALRKEARQAPVPASLDDVRATDDEPKLALSAVAQQEHSHTRTFWQVNAPQR
ncbi:hypothetical protein MBRA1_002657 [Malassezia brasiliensis]|uniref:Uncharacterized protein n=1 Tax=Malassezia brasiliensis TaxID=1821822 RepID=A0AAF0IQF1_9BASI|nr:hypothetical protein MBRA1_002657 [Malassezia brasiliensis]